MTTSGSLRRALRLGVTPRVIALLLLALLGLLFWTSSGLSQANRSTGRASLGSVRPSGRLDPAPRPA